MVALVVPHLPLSSAVVVAVAVLLAQRQTAVSAVPVALLRPSAAAVVVLVTMPAMASPRAARPAVAAAPV